MPGRQTWIQLEWETNRVKTPKRPYHHGNLRDAALAAALKALEAQGSHNLSLRELSRELGVSHSAFRRHFTDKQALLYALAIRGFEQYGDVLARAIADRGADFGSRLARVIRSIVRFAAAHPVLLELMFASKQHPDAPPELLEASERALSAGPQLILDGQKVGQVIAGDPVRLALAPFAAVHGLIAISNNGMLLGVPLEKLARETVEQIILGLRPRL
jgi:AcrR family transcriptional regulator